MSSLREIYDLQFNGLNALVDENSDMYNYVQTEIENSRIPMGYREMQNYLKRNNIVKNPSIITLEFLESTDNLKILFDVLNKSAAYLDYCDDLNLNFLDKLSKHIINDLLYEHILYKFYEQNYNVINITQIVDQLILKPFYIKYFDNTFKLTVEEYTEYTHEDLYIPTCQKVLTYIFSLNQKKDFNIIMFLYNSKFIHPTEYKSIFSILEFYNKNVSTFLSKFDSITVFQNILKHYSTHFNEVKTEHFITLLDISRSYTFIFNLFISNYESLNDEQINKKLSTNIKETIPKEFLKDLREFMQIMIRKLIFSAKFDDFKMFSRKVLSYNNNIKKYLQKVYDELHTQPSFKKDFNNILYLTQIFFTMYLDILYIFANYCETSYDYESHLREIYSQIQNLQRFIVKCPIKYCNSIIDNIIIDAVLSISYKNKFQHTPDKNSELYIYTRVANIHGLYKFYDLFKPHLTKQNLPFFENILAYKSCLCWRLSGGTTEHLFKDFIINTFFKDCYENKWDAEIEIIKQEKLEDDAKDAKKRLKNKKNNSTVSRGIAAMTIFDADDDDENEEFVEIDFETFIKQENIADVKDNITDQEKIDLNILNTVNFEVYSANNLITYLKRLEQSYANKHPVHTTEIYKSKMGHCPDNINDTTIFEIYDELSNEQLLECYCDRMKRQNAFIEYKRIFDDSISKMISRITNVIINVNKLNSEIKEQNIKILQKKIQLLEFVQSNNSKKHEKHYYPITTIKEILKTRNVSIPNC